jgi:hypothetical protein
MTKQQKLAETLRSLTPQELIHVEGGARHLYPVEPIDGISPIVITPIIGPVIAELEP